MAKLSVIIPCYYNEANIPVTAAALLAAESQYPAGTKIEYVWVDDGSRDQTFGALLQFHYRHPDRVRIIRLAGNVGSYNAIVAGMQYATGDCCAVIAADLQDPPEILVRMYEKWCAGHKLVIANRTGRSDGWLSDRLSGLYHRLIRRYAIHNLPDGGFDVALFDARLREEVVKMSEKNTNTLYLLPYMGFDPVCLPYERQKRRIGRSRWTLSKKIKLFIDSFISFSFLPVRLITAGGLLLGTVALLYAIFIVACRISGVIHVEGWSTLMVVLLFVSAFQMIAIGIVGEYVWRTLDAARHRPMYIVDQIVETT